MAKSLRLEIEPDYTFLLFGIVTSEPLYRLSWLINQALHLNLSADKPVRVMHSKRQVVQEFELFRFINEGEHIFELFQNKGQQGSLIEEHKQTDFFFKIYGENSLKEVVANPLSGEWNKKSLNYWQLIFDIKNQKESKRNVL